MAEQVSGKTFRVYRGDSRDVYDEVVADGFYSTSVDNHSGLFFYKGQMKDLLDDNSNVVAAFKYWDRVIEK